MNETFMKYEEFGFFIITVEGGLLIIINFSLCV